MSWLLAHGLAPAYEERLGSGTRYTPLSACLGLERDQISKRVAEASNAVLAGAALCAVVLPHFTELVALPVFAGDALRS